MKSLIGIYQHHAEAIEDIKLLKKNGFSSNQVSFLGRAVEADDFKDSVQQANVAVTGIGLGAVLGTAAGVLAGIGLAVVPGLGFLVGAGALAGAVAGFDFGVIGGSLVSALAIAGLKKDAEERYQRELDEGKSLLVVQATEAELQRAKKILESEGKQIELDAY